MTACVCTCAGAATMGRADNLPLRDFVDIVLGINAGAFSIEAANPRHVHEDEVWEDVELPPDTILIPGVIGHCSDSWSTQSWWPGGSFGTPRWLVERT